MLALACGAGLRREELCSLRTDDLDPARRTLRIRAETTKNRLERVVPYSAPTGVLLSDYLAHRARPSRARGPLFRSESRRNYAQPLSLWMWSKVVRLGSFQRLILSWRIVGRDRVDGEIARLREVLGEWGYRLGHDDDTLLLLVACQLFLLNHSPHLEDLTTGAVRSDPP